MDAFFDGRLHQRVVRGVEAHQVDAVAEAVVGVEFGRIPVGQGAQLQVVGRAGELAEARQVRLRPGRAFALDGLPQGRVLRVHVVARQLRRDVDDLVRLVQKA